MRITEERRILSLGHSKVLVLPPEDTVKEELEDTIESKLDDDIEEIKRGYRKIAWCYY